MFDGYCIESLLDLTTKVMEVSPLELVELIECPPEIVMPSQDEVN